MDILNLTKYQMQVQRTQNIKITILLILPFCFLNCKDEGDNKDDVRAIIEIMDNYTYNNTKPNVIADKIGVLILGNAYSKESIEMLTDLDSEPVFRVEDLDYINK